MTPPLIPLILLSLWGSLLLQALAISGAMLPGARRSPDAGTLLLAMLSLAGLSAAQWLSLLPGMDPRWSGIAFLGALLLPSVALMRLEQESGISRGPLARSITFAGAFLPALLLPAQIVGTLVCLAPGSCSPAGPLILLLHLATGALLLMLALPAIAVLSRPGRSRSGPSFWRSAGGALYLMALLHLANVFMRISETARPDLRRELAVGALQLVLMYLLSAHILASLSRPAQSSAAAAVEPAACAAQPLAELALLAEPANGCRLQQIAAPDEPLSGEVDAAAAVQMQDPVLFARISEAALALLRDQGLYRQPQLRRKDLAERLKVADYLLSRALNASTGQSFVDLVNGLRVEEAQSRLLQLGSERITTIGYDVGFNSLAAFNRAFREATGQSPTEYRQQPASTAPLPLGQASEATA
ncbi:helix-turn-helix transcriptional regulator [Polaromonas sp.]|uniref:helix-turn-helix transcriptional regulator n=1 Tax=Polaromonas sp. TaxID=1869339 RepID=UPI00356AA9AD